MLSTSDKQYLQSLIREGEHQQQDFKYRVSDAQKQAKMSMAAPSWWSQSPLQTVVPSMPLAMKVSRRPISA